MGTLSDGLSLSVGRQRQPVISAMSNVCNRLAEIVGISELFALNRSINSKSRMSAMRCGDHSTDCSPYRWVLVYLLECLGAYLIPFLNHPSCCCCLCRATALSAAARLDINKLGNGITPAQARYAACGPALMPRFRFSND